MRCGACCFSESPRHARVSGDDYARLGDDAPSLVMFIDNQAFMRLVHDGGSGPMGPIGRCTALTLDPAAETYVCSIYRRRPEVCRALERGSDGCTGELASKGARTHRALAMMPR